MKNIVKTIFAVIAILAGIAAIIRVAGSYELIILFITLTFGVLAIMWSFMAYSSLSAGSSLRNYTGYFLACLIFVLIYFLWNSAVKLFDIGSSWEYLSYIFMIAAYLVFAIAAYKIYHLGREFGFQKEASRVKKAMDSRKKK